MSTMSEKSRTHTVLCVLGLCIWNLACAIDATALSVALPTISNELHADSISIYWAGAAFVLCSAVFQPIFASITAFGQRFAILLALSFFTVGSIVCALSHNVATLIAGRCLQGCGGGGLIILTYVVMASLFNLEQRSQYTSVIGMVWTVGTVCGPVIGGGFAEVSWRGIFWLNVPLAAISFFLVVFYMHIEQKPPESIMARLKKIDWLGCFLLSTSLTLITMSISWGGVMYSWSSWRTLVPLIGGVLVLVGWVMYSYSGIISNPMIPLVVLNDRTAAISYFGNLVHGLAQFGILYYLPLYYQVALSYSPLISGLALLPQCLLSGPSTAITGLLIAKTHLTKPFSFIGWLLFTYGLTELNLLTSSTTVFDWIILNIPSGIGLGILFASLSLSTQASAENRADCSPEEKVKVKTFSAGLNPFFRAVGQASGIAIGQSVFSNQISARLGPETGRDAVALVSELKNLEVSDPQRVVIVNAFVGSLRVLWWILVSTTALLAVLTLFTRDFAFVIDESVESEMAEVRCSDGESA
ncbi:hypothetical protein Vi05172_g11253 [Venturia inaequalis]|nr:hypothetical protein Vi05172_g11253 [Venturia inaequalis]